MTDTNTTASIGVDALIQQLETCLGDPVYSDAAIVGKKTLRQVIKVLASAAQPAAAPDANVAAWMTPEGDRVVSAKTMAGARNDGGAILSGLRSYSVPLVRAGAAQPAAVPPGYVLVPDAANMTDAQAEAIAEQANCCGGVAYDIYCAALAAAPKAAPAAQGDARQPLHPVEAMRLVMDAEREHQFLRGTTNWAVAVARAVERAHGIGTAAARAAKEGDKT